MNIENIAKFVGFVEFMGGLLEGIFGSKEGAIYLMVIGIGTFILIGETWERDKK